MTVHIRTLRTWKYLEDPDGNAVRVLPAARAYSLEDAIGLLAIADGAAEPTVDLTDDQAFQLAAIKAAASGDEEALGRLLSGGTADDDSDNTEAAEDESAGAEAADSDGASDPAPTPAAKPARKPASRKAKT